MSPGETLCAHVTCQPFDSDVLVKVHPGALSGQHGNTMWLLVVYFNPVTPTKEVVCVFQCKHRAYIVTCMQGTRTFELKMY